MTLMKKIAFAVLAGAAALSLSACGSTDDASEDAMAQDVELPAEEAVGDAAMPVDDPAAAAVDDAVDDAEAAADATPAPAATPTEAAATE
jgi:hypothetical protein